MVEVEEVLEPLVLPHQQYHLLVHLVAKEFFQTLLEQQFKELAAEAVLLNLLGPALLDQEALVAVVRQHQ
jgi:hypothetical protein